MSQRRSRTIHFTSRSFISTHKRVRHARLLPRCRQDASMCWSMPWHCMLVSNSGMGIDCMHAHLDCELFAASKDIHQIVVEVRNDRKLLQLLKNLDERQQQTRMASG
eukprot:365920-Chlamydomonas_euryale.AAC.14